MYCKKCGAELLEGIKFCPECGEPVGTTEVIEGEVVDFEQPAATPRPHVAKCFTIFGKLGYIFGLISFIFSFIPFMCFVSLELAPIGLVFSILGRKDESLAAKTKKGKTFSILGLVFGFIMTIVTGVIMALLEMELYY